MGHPNIEAPSKGWESNPPNVSVPGRATHLESAPRFEFLCLHDIHRNYEILTIYRCVASPRIELESHPSQGRILSIKLCSHCYFEPSTYFAPWFSILSFQYASQPCFLIIFILSSIFNSNSFFLSERFFSILAPLELFVIIILFISVGIAIILKVNCISFFELLVP